MAQRRPIKDLHAVDGADPFTLIKTAALDRARKTIAERKTPDSLTAAD